MRERQPNPADNRIIDSNLVDEDPDFGNMRESNLEPQYIRDKRIKDRLEKRQSLKKRAGFDFEDDHMYR